MTMSNKKLYRFYEDDDFYKTLLLSDEQVAVFFFLADRGHDIRLEEVKCENPIEIKLEDWIEK